MFIICYCELLDVKLSDVAVSWLSTTEDLQRDVKTASDIVEAVYRYTTGLEQEIRQQPGVISSFYRIHATVRAPEDENES